MRQSVCAYGRTEKGGWTLVLMMRTLFTQATTLLRWKMSPRFRTTHESRWVTTLCVGLISNSFQAENGKSWKSSKLKDQKNFLLVHGFSNRGKVNSASSTVSPSSRTFKDLVAKGHSSFFNFSPRTGSLEHAPVSGKLVASSLRGLHCCVPVASEVSNQAIFLEEYRRDPEFRNRALGLERTLRVKAQNETNIRDFDNGVDSGSVAEPVRSSELVVGLASVVDFEVTSEFDVGAASAEASERAVTAGGSQRIIGLRERYESAFPSLNSSGCFEC